MNETTTVLMETLRTHPDRVTRYNAAVRLAASETNATAVAELGRLMVEAEDWGVRQCAAWAGGQIGTADLIPALALVMNRQDEDEQVRYVAALALARIGTGAAVDQLKQAAEDAHRGVARAAGSAMDAMAYFDVTPDEAAN